MQELRAEGATRQGLAFTNTWSTIWPKVRMLLEDVGPAGRADCSDHRRVGEHAAPLP